MGLWEDAQSDMTARKAAEAAAERAKQEAHAAFEEQQLRAAQEFVEAMSRLGIPSQQHQTLSHVEEPKWSVGVVSSSETIHYFRAGSPLVTGWLVGDPRVAIQLEKGHARRQRKALARSANGLLSWEGLLGERLGGALDTPVILNSDGMACLAWRYDPETNWNNGIGKSWGSWHSTAACGGGEFVGPWHMHRVTRDDSGHAHLADTLRSVLSSLLEDR